MEKPKITAEELLSILDPISPMSITIINNGWRKEFYPDPDTGEFRMESECANKLVDRVTVQDGEDDFGNPDKQITIFLR